MREFEHTVKDELGIHARPAGLLVKKAKEYESEIIIEKGEKSAVATKLIAIMGLCVKCNDIIKIKISGSDEEKAEKELKEFLGANF
ncbi:MAG: HPr family phosphocarrier protein [Clostridia bacterium]|nr:HPr family phosphocarrier protein [Clostridia bacterium]